MKQLSQVLAEVAAVATSSDIPIIIPCFNNPSYVRSMLNQLNALGKGNIILIDGFSTYPKMLDLLREIKTDVRIIRLRRNYGPKYFCKNWLFYLRLPTIFCVTDPDLRFNKSMPPDFLDALHEATKEFAIGKAGLSLDISEPARMRADRITFAGRIYTICDWEAQYWRDQVSTTPAGDPIFKAAIDTTFALYNKRYFRKRTFEEGLRFGGRFTAQHLPWYLDNGLPAEEESFYRGAVNKHSWYFGEKTSGSSPSAG